MSDRTTAKDVAGMVGFSLLVVAVLALAVWLISWYLGQGDKAEDQCRDAGGVWVEVDERGVAAHCELSEP